MLKFYSHGLEQVVDVGARADDLVDLVELVEGEALPLDGVVLQDREERVDERGASRD